MAEYITVTINRSLVKQVQALEREKADVERDLDNALSVVDRLIDHMDGNDYPKGMWLEWWCMGHDHQLYDDLLGLPARKD